MPDRFCAKMPSGQGRASNRDAETANERVNAECTSRVMVPASTSAAATSFVDGRVAWCVYDFEGGREYSRRLPSGTMKSAVATRQTRGFPLSWV